MKKLNILRLISTVAIAAAGVFGIASVKESKKAQSVSAAGTIGSTITVYFDCSGDLSWWTGDSAETHVHYYGGSSSSTWPGAKMSLVSGETYLFSCDIPSNTTKVNFTRVQPNTSNVWNRIATSTDINVPVWTSNNTFHAYHDGYGDGNYAGSWELTSYTLSQYRVLDGVKEASAFNTDTVGGGLTYGVPSDPTYSNYTFAGWYTNEACTTPYTSRMIKEDTTIYAKFTTTKYTVYKYKVLNGGSPVLIESEEVGSGTVYSVPANRYEAGYTFGGWYSNDACTSSYTGSTITSNTSLYAKYTSGSWSGSIYVDLRDSGWAGAAAHYAVMFMDKTTYPTEIDGWSSYVTGTKINERLVEIPYSLEFEPLKMTIVRYNPAKTDWATQKWTNTWGQTPDIDVAEVVRIGDTTDGEGKNYAYAGYPKVVTWSPSSADIYLNSVKMNGDKNSEYYSSTVSLAANQQFKIQVGPYASGDYYGAFSTHSSLESTFDGDGTNNITCKAAGTYAFYFDSFKGSVYITKVEIAQADEWAEAFLGMSASSNNCAYTKTHWSEASTAYNGLSAAAKALCVAEAHIGPHDEAGTYLAEAIQRYDYVIQLYGTTSYPDFIGRVSAGKISLSQPILLLNINNRNTTPMIVIIVVSLVGFGAVGGYFFIRRRKEN